MEAFDLLPEFENNQYKPFYRTDDIIKKSNYKEKKFYPIIITVGTIRDGVNGIIDMDYKFQQFAYNAGFVLYDKLFTENNTPGAGFTFRRNFKTCFLTKSHETTLIFMKF